MALRRYQSLPTRGNDNGSAASGGPPSTRKLSRGVTTGSISPEQIQGILADFTANLDKYLLESDFEPKEEEVEEVKSNVNDQLLVRYKIGRFNPPHPGHIQLFINNIEEMRAAKAANPSLTTRVVILAGDGAKTEPRSKNPLDYLTKKEVIEYLLGVQGYHPYDSNGIGDFEILNKGVPQQTLGTVFSSTINPDINTATAQLGVSAKDDDATKLSFINKALIDLFKKNYQGISFVSEIVPMKPITHDGVVYSATQMRNFANTLSFEEFKIATNKFYGDQSETVYNAIKMYPEITSLGDANNKLPEKLGKLPRDKPFRTTLRKPIGGSKKRRGTKGRRSIRKRRSIKRRR
jgi:hypothetical protein